MITEIPDELKITICFNCGNLHIVEEENTLDMCQECDSTDLVTKTYIIKIKNG